MRKNGDASARASSSLGGSARVSLPVDKTIPSNNKPRKPRTNCRRRVEAYSPRVLLTSATAMAKSWKNNSTRKEPMNPDSTDGV